VGGELLAAGGQVYLDQNARIGSDATIAGGNINIAGTINGDVLIYGDMVQIDGRIGGNVKVKATQKLVIGPGAVIAGTLNYRAPQEAVIQQGAQIGGEVNFEKYQPKYGQKGKGGFWGALFAWSLVKLIMMIVAALMIFFLLRKRMDEATKYVLANFGKETLRGFIILVVFPIAIILSFVTIIGAFLGILGLLLYLLTMLFASIFSIFLVGALFYRLVLKKANFGADWKSVIIGALIMWIFGLIPVVGWIFNFIFFLAAFGGAFYLLYGSFRRN
jgi:cytoskeletal protein CcmA (bactofilin family)